MPQDVSHSPEAIRILNHWTYKPRRTIRIALWGGEEQDYTEYSVMWKTFWRPGRYEIDTEQAHISAYYNLDNGSGKIRGIYTQGNDAVREILKPGWLFLQIRVPMAA